MPKISRLPLSSEKMAECMNMLWSAATLAESKEDVRLLFKDLFSHTEQKMFAKRLAVARKLLDGRGYDEIIRELKVTDRTVAHINNILAEKGEGFRKAHAQLDLVEKGRRQKEAARIERMINPIKARLKATSLLPLAVLQESGTAVLKEAARKQKQKSAKKKLAI